MQATLVWVVVVAVSHRRKTAEVGCLACAVLPAAPCVFVSGGECVACVQMVILESLVCVQCHHDSELLSCTFISQKLHLGCVAMSPCRRPCTSL